MEFKKNLAPFREFIKLNHKNALIYSNNISKFAEKSFRGEAFKIKSDLAHNVNKDEYLYIPVNLGRVITRIYTDFVIGMWYNVDFGTDKINKKFVELSDKLQLQIKLNEAINNQSSIGYGILRLRKKDDKPRVELIPLPNYLANMEWLSIGDTFEDIKEHVIFTVQRDEVDGTSYFLVDRYEKEWNKRRGYYKERRANNGNFILTERLLEAEEEELLDSLPLYIFNNDLDNPHVVGMDEEIRKLSKTDIGEIPRYFHQSDYVDLGDLFQEINDRGSQISVEFIKNLTSKMSVPAGFMNAQTVQGLRNGANPENKKFSKNPDFLVHNAGEEPAKYIEKDATYVQVSIKDYMPYLLKLIGFLASIPTVLLANAIYGANNPVGTTEKEFTPFYKRVEKKQQMIYSSLQRLFKDLMLYAGITTDLPTIKFNKPTAYDIAERTNTAVQQMNAGIMSKSSAIAYTMWYDEQEVQEELDKIAEEETEAYKKYDSKNMEFKDEDVDEKKDDSDENLDENVDDKE